MDRNVHVPTLRSDPYDTCPSTCPPLIMTPPGLLCRARSGWIRRNETQRICQGRECAWRRQSLVQRRRQPGGQSASPKWWSLQTTPAEADIQGGRHLVMQSSSNHNNSKSNHSNSNSNSSNNNNKHNNIHNSNNTNIRTSSNVDTEDTYIYIYIYIYTYTYVYIHIYYTYTYIHTIRIYIYIQNVSTPRIM